MTHGSSDLELNCVRVSENWRYIYFLSFYGLTSLTVIVTVALSLQVGEQAASAKSAASTLVGR